MPLVRISILSIWQSEKARPCRCGAWSLGIDVHYPANELFQLVIAVCGREYAD